MLVILPGHQYSVIDGNELMLVNGEEQEMDALSEALASAMVSSGDNENSDGDTAHNASSAHITYASRMTSLRADPAWSQLRSMITDMTEDDEVTMMEVDALMDAHDETVRRHALRFTRDELRLVHILFDSVYNAIDDNVEEAFLSVLSTLRSEPIDTVLAGESEPEMERHGDTQTGQALAGTVKTMGTMGTMSTSGSSDDRVMPRSSTVSPIMSTLSSPVLSPVLHLSMPATVRSSSARRLGKPRKIRLLRSRAVGTGVSTRVSTRMGTVNGIVPSTSAHARSTGTGKTEVMSSLSVPRLVLNTGDNAIHDSARDSIHSAHGLMMRKR